MRMRSMLLSITAMALLGATPGHATDSRLKIEVSPRISQAPAAVRIRAAVTPSETNRGLKIVADSGEYFRSSYISLDAADTITVTSFKNLPSGQYDVSVTLVEADGSHVMERRTIMVAGSVR
jgi:methionine-rich copper-binding protein CopC